MSSTTGVNAMPKPPAAAAGGATPARTDAATEESGGFAALLSNAEVQTQDAPPWLHERAELSPPADAPRADPAHPPDAASPPWAAALPMPTAPQAARPVTTMPQGERVDPLARAPATTQAGAAAEVAAQDPAAVTQESTDPAEPLLQQAELARRATQQRARAAAGAPSDAAEAGSRGRQPALQQALQQQTAALQASAQGTQAAPPAALAAAWLGSGSEPVRSWRTRDEERGREPAGLSAVTGAHSAQASAAVSTASGGTTALPVPAAAPDAALLTPQRVAEQLSYWVRRGVHNAELELDGPGERAVQVSIALQGQQARVEFRSDLAQTRQLLQDAAPQLRELLASEGLVLADVSVGAWGGERGQGGAGAQNAPAGGRRMLAVDVSAVVLPSAARASGSGPGRALDLYV
jgi:flagellar hook-length control protein FliK